jgi:6-phosphogluconate dehydrogenase
MGIKIPVWWKGSVDRLIIIVMGVTGSGKTTLGRALAEQLALPFQDADDFHPEQNRIKLRSNIPLNDEDRLPWLELLSQRLAEWDKHGGAVLACSALKEHYREILRSYAPATILVYLHGDKQLIADRLKQRAVRGHELIAAYDSILNGQFRDLEIPADSITIPVTWPVAQAVTYVCAQLELKSGSK